MVTNSVGATVQQSEHLERLRRQSSRCRELAETASDDETAVALRETADNIDAVLAILGGGGSANEGSAG